MKKHLILALSIILMTAAAGCAAATTDLTATDVVTTATSAFTTTSTVTATSPGTTAVPTYTLSQVRDDFDQLVSELSRNPKLFTDDLEFSRVMSEERALLHGGMTKLELYRTFSRVISALRCGHSGMVLPTNVFEDIYLAGYEYPVDALLFEGKLRVVAVNRDLSIEVGDEIVAIDGVSVQDTTAEMMRYLSADGEGTAMKTRILAESYFTNYLLYLADDDVLEIEYVDADTGIAMTLALERDLPIVDRNELPRPSVESEFHEGYAVLTVRSFYPNASETVASICAQFDAFFARVDDEGIRHVVIDLRGNGGGDPVPSSRLFSYLAAVSQPYFRADAPNYYPGLKSDVPLLEPHYDGAVYTLIDGLCFSTTGHFAALLKFQDIGTFIGTETGGSFVCTDNSANFTLSRTGMRFRMSRTVWGVAVEGFTLGRGIAPDIPLEITFDDYMADVDTVMAAAVALIEAALHP